MKGLILLSCNAGIIDYKETNVAAAFSRLIEDAPVLASDGTVNYHKKNNINLFEDEYSSSVDRVFLESSINRTTNEGWFIYCNNKAPKKVTVSDPFALTVSEMIDQLQNYK